MADNEKKRDLPADAREVVGRMQGLDADCTWGDVFAALFGETISPTGAELRYHLCDLIEHGGKQDVDVETLRELADSLVQWVCIDGTANDVLKCAADRFVPNNAMPYLIRNGAVMQAIVASIGGSIREAIDGAPVDLATAADNLVARCRYFLFDRDAAADWVEAHGGIKELESELQSKDDYFDIFNHISDHQLDMARVIGIKFGGKTCCEIHGAIMAELDKRLMPEGMEWPTNAAGEKLTFGMEFTAPEYGIKEPQGITRICLFSPNHFEDGASGSLCEVNYLRTDDPGYRVERPKPAVLGADGKPIEVGQTVWDSTSPHESASYNAWRHGGPLKVLCRNDTRAGFVICEDDRETPLDCCAADLTHERPDTQERIDGDKRKSSYLYWGCLGASCLDCPALINDKQPRHHYGTSDCAVAQGMDIARREQELHARTGGAR